MTAGVHIAAVVGKPAQMPVGGAQGAEAGKFPSVLQTVRTKRGAGKPAAKAFARATAPKVQRQEAADENQPAVSALRGRDGVNRTEKSKATPRNAVTEDRREEASTDDPTVVATPSGAPVPSAESPENAAATVPTDTTAGDAMPESSAGEDSGPDKQVKVALGGSDGIGMEAVVSPRKQPDTGKTTKVCDEDSGDGRTGAATKARVEPEHVESKDTGDRQHAVKLREATQSEKTQGELVQQDESPGDNTAESDSGQDGADKPHVTMPRGVSVQGRGNKAGAKHDADAPELPEVPSTMQQVHSGELFRWEEPGARVTAFAGQVPGKGAGLEEDGVPQAPTLEGLNAVHGTTPVQRAPHGAEPAATAQELPAFDRHQTLEQVVLGIRGKLDARNGQAEIRLDPPNLGSLHVSVRLENGALTAQFEAGSDLVRDLLNSNIGKLRSVLEGQGITVDKLAVRSGAEVAASPATERFIGSPNHDGRSAGSYSQDPRQRQRPPEEPGQGAFAAAWRQATNQPVDVVA